MTRYAPEGAASESTIDLNLRLKARVAAIWGPESMAPSIL
jgi:hypothetical protein